MGDKAAEKKEQKKEKKRKPSIPYTLYPPEIVAKTLSIYAQNNNLNETSRITGIFPQTIAAWRDKQKSDYLAMRETAQRRLISGTTHIIDKALGRIEESIDKGYDDPYKLSLIVGVLYDKRALAQGEATQNISSIVKIEDFPETKA